MVVSNRDTGITASTVAAFILRALYAMRMAGKVTHTFHDNLWDGMREHEAERGRTDSEAVWEAVKKAPVRGIPLDAALRDVVKSHDILEWISEHPDVIARLRNKVHLEGFVLVPDA